MKNMELAGLSKQERKIISNFSSMEKDVIDSEDLMAMHSCKKMTANQILSRLERKGWLQRLKHGRYAIVPLESLTADPIVENVWPLAMKLFDPAFISGWSAAEHWDLTEQIFNSVSVITAKPQRKTVQVIGNVRYRTRTLAKEHFFGTKTIWIGNKPVKIADPSRVIIDILDLPRFGGGMRHVIDVVRKYWKSEMCNPDVLLDYAIRYNHGSVLKRLGFLTEMLNVPVSKKWIELCNNNLPSGIIFLDPDGSEKGKIITKWNIRMNIDL